jgi:hypothetical protein
MEMRVQRNTCFAGAMFGENAETGLFLKTASSSPPAASPIPAWRSGPI